MRLDGNLDAVSVSIHSVNEHMFAAKRRGGSGEWAIFVLDATILWALSCRFCWKNAASKEIRNHRGFIRGPWAFRKMFEDRAISQMDGRSARTVWSRQAFEPTDGAAEVQVLQPVRPDLILGVIVSNRRAQAELEALMQNIDRVRRVEVQEQLFV